MRVPDVIPPPSTKDIYSSDRHSAGCAAQSVFPFSTSPGMRVFKVSGREMLSFRMADSGLLLELKVERWNSKYDLECRGCCGSVCSCKSKQQWSLDGVKFPFDSDWWLKAPDCSSKSKYPFYYSLVQHSSEFKRKSPVFPGNLYLFLVKSI
ncbi:hypothetical protein AVEN_125527-1 [Araneus ventricosus]|uniref:Uncharacterized protein n=1 Tax=Araneus ventricosus TaxID=182803 RepID=A0A4Y2QK97_ARAVE|nr:hypothetical protein AVEN_125527-1 [Araneus ventricosus]